MKNSRRDISKEKWRRGKQDERKGRRDEGREGM